MPLSFEWDNDKAEANLLKHGVDFIDAAQIFAGPMFASSMNGMIMARGGLEPSARPTELFSS